MTRGFIWVENCVSRAGTGGGRGGVGIGGKGMESGSARAVVRVCEWASGRDLE